jgi:hypothetical protein
VRCAGVWPTFKRRALFVLPDVLGSYAARSENQKETVMKYALFVLAVAVAMACSAEVYLTHGW